MQLSYYFSYCQNASFCVPEISIKFTSYLHYSTEKGGIPLDFKDRLCKQSCGSLPVQEIMFMLMNYLVLCTSACHCKPFTSDQW